MCQSRVKLARVERDNREGRVTGGLVSSIAEN